VSNAEAIGAKITKVNANEIMIARTLKLSSVHFAMFRGMVFIKRAYGTPASKKTLLKGSIH
jgi:hypothetical protein